MDTPDIQPVQPPTAPEAPVTPTVPPAYTNKKIIAVIVFLVLYGIGMAVLVQRFVLKKKTAQQAPSSQTQQPGKTVTPTPTPICPDTEVAQSVDDAHKKSDTTCAIYMSSHTEPAGGANIEEVQDAPRTGSAIGNIPDSVGDIRNLKVLQANRADLMSVPSTLHLLTELRYLSLSVNNFRIIPAEILLLPNLTALDMSRNLIMEVPADIGKLSHLEHLFLYGNKISELPPEIGNLTNLTILQLSENRITKLPDSIRNLTKLTDLYVSKNPLEDGELERIKSLLPSINVHF